MWVRVWVWMRPLERGGIWLLLLGCLVRAWESVGRMCLILPWQSCPVTFGAEGTGQGVCAR